MTSSKIPKIVVIGGGTGIFNLLRGLKHRRCEVAAVVTMADDGGSTGKLRDEYGVLPPGDVRQALVALSYSGKIWRDLFAYRLKNGGLSGHTFGNLFLSVLEHMTGDFQGALNLAAEVLNTKGKVIPVTLTNTRLVAELASGKIVKGEHEIGLTSDIKRVFLNPKPKANKAALRAIKDADLIVLGPGSLFTSLLPNLAVPGLAAAIKKSRAKKVFICNIMTQPNETLDFTLADFLRFFKNVFGQEVFDNVLYNSLRPSKKRLLDYAEKSSLAVELGKLGKDAPKIIKRNLITRTSYIRHDPKKVADAVLRLV